MPIDTSMYNALQPVKIDSPIDAYGKVAQFQQMQNQNRLADLMFGEKQRQADRQNKLLQLAGGWGADTTDDQRIAAMKNSGFFNEADALEGSMLKRKEVQSKADASDFEVANKRYDAYRKTAGALYNAPNVSRDMVAQEVQNLQSAGVLSQPLAEKLISTLPEDPTQLRQVLRQAISSQLTPEQMITLFAPKVDKTDTGGKVKFIDTNPNSPTFGKEVVQAQSKTMTPGEAASNAVAWANNKVSRDRLEYDKSQPKGQIIQTEDGPMLADPRTGSARPLNGPGGQPLPDKMQAKKQASARNLLPILDEADKLVDGATGSYLGYGVDQTARAFGKVTEGSKNVAQLKVLEGNLMLNQPRMEGPQSDKDVMMYRQMAGQIGDPTVPREIKKAALSTIRKLTEKYAGVQQPSDPAGATPSASPKAGTVENGYRFKGGNPADPKSWEKV